MLTLRNELVSRRAMWLAYAAAAVLSGGCGDGINDPSEPGSIQINVSTTGGDPDPNGYVLVLGERRLSTISTGYVAFTRVPPGTHALYVEDIEHNCDVTGGNPQLITVGAGGIVDHALHVTCAATGIALVVTSSGQDIPDRFDVFINGFPAGKVTAQGTTLVSNLQPGNYGVRLDLPGSCLGDGSKSVSVASRAVITIEFTVTCDPADLIAFTAWGNGPMIDLIDSRGGARRSLMRGSEPSWSPDGSRIALTSLLCFYGWYYYYGSCDGGIEILNVGTGTRTLLPRGALGRAPAWAPTGDLIAFDRVDVEGNPKALLYLMRPDGTLTDSLAFPGIIVAADPTWSPDGQRIAFVCSFSTPSGVINHGICVVNRDGLGFARLTESAGSVSDAAWSPGGNQIAFATSTGISLLNVSTREITALTSGRDPAWSPDGTRLAFSSGDGLYVMNSDGSDPRQISAGTHYDPAWRP